VFAGVAMLFLSAIVVLYIALSFYGGMFGSMMKEAG
jgi:hypothetical protein